MSRNVQSIILPVVICLAVAIVVLRFRLLPAGGELGGVIQRVENRNAAGRITLRQVGGQTVADITMDAYKNDEIQSVSVVAGSCENRKAVLYHLTYLYSGYSNTTMNFPIRQIVRQLPLAVIITRTKQWDSPVVFCGSLERI